MSDVKHAELAETLAAVTPSGKTPLELLGAAKTQQALAALQELADLGFALQVGADTLRVHHRGADYETVLHLSQQGDLGELRHLFRSLRRRFGRRRERCLPWLFLPGPAVTAPYNAIRQLTSICQHLRHQRLSPPD